MPSRGRTIAKELAASAETFTTELVERLFGVEVPQRLPDVQAECLAPTLSIYPVEDARERDGQMIVRRPEIELLFRAPIDAAAGLEEWEAAAELYVDHLEGSPRGGCGWFATSVSTPWDPATADVGVFQAAFRLVYSQVAVANC